MTLIKPLLVSFSLLALAVAQAQAADEAKNKSETKAKSEQSATGKTGSEKRASDTPASASIASVSDQPLAWTTSVPDIAW